MSPLVFEEVVVPGVEIPPVELPAENIHGKRSFTSTLPVLLRSPLPDLLRFPAKWIGLVQTDLEA